MQLENIRKASTLGVEETYGGTSEIEQTNNY